jgi:hypothetical protein
MIKTFRYRVKDRTSARHLRRQAGTVNFVWNYCCATQREAQRRRRAGSPIRWPTYFDLAKLMTGACRDLGVHSQRSGGLAQQFVHSRDAADRCPAWRSRGKGSLGWVPLAAAAIRGRRLQPRRRSFACANSRRVKCPHCGGLSCGGFAASAPAWPCRSIRTCCATVAASSSPTTASIRTRYSRFPWLPATLLIRTNKVCIG